MHSLTISIANKVNFNFIKQLYVIHPTHGNILPSTFDSWWAVVQLVTLNNNCCENSNLYSICH